MHRRELLKTLTAATALAFVPHSEALAAWSRVTSGVPVADGLTEAQLALVGALADIILPRTDSPSASDVGVPAFVNVIVSENYTDAERNAFVGGLDAIAALGASEATIQSIESSTDRRGEPARTYWRLKGLIIHGYFTSERVSKDVLHNEVMPGRFDGAAPMVPHVIQAGKPGND